MTPLNPNTQAILLLTAPLMVGPRATSAELLTPTEYAKLARRLVELKHTPADLLGEGAADLLRAVDPILPASRVEKLLARGFSLAQAVEFWQTRSIWVVSRADASYPRRLKSVMREGAPPVLYGCGNAELLEGGGLAVVGSRDVSEDLLAYTAGVGRLAAAAGVAIVSGGARGVDSAAMKGALDADGRVVGVLADSLLRAALHRDNRDALMRGRLVLVSPYDPSAGFNVGHAMQRNKLIYAFAGASLVVNAEVNKGGTWAGAIEQLQTYKFGDLYVRSTGDRSEGLVALRGRGALAWPNPAEPASLQALVVARAQAATDHRVVEQRQPSLLDHATAPAADRAPATAEPAMLAHEPSASPDMAQAVVRPEEQAEAPPTSASALFGTFRSLVLELLDQPRDEAEVSAQLGVLPAQAKAWLNRLIEEGSVERRGRPARYGRSTPTLVPPAKRTRSSRVPSPEPV